jgi:hypothetical protein
VDPFYRDPPGLLREGDKSEATGGHDDELRWCFPVFLAPYLLPFLLAYDDGSVDRPPLRRHSRTVLARALSPRDASVSDALRYPTASSPWVADSTLSAAQAFSTSCSSVVP